MKTKYWRCWRFYSCADRSRATVYGSVEHGNVVMMTLSPEHDFQAVANERTLKSVKVTVKNK